MIYTKEPYFNILPGNRKPLFSEIE